MAKIVGDGKRWSMIVTCPHCKNQIEIEASDIIYMYGSLGDSYDYSDFYYRCPADQSLVKLLSSKIPPGVQQRAIKKAYAKARNRYSEYM